MKISERYCQNIKLIHLDRYKLFEEIQKLKSEINYYFNLYDILLSQWYLNSINHFENKKSDSITKFSLHWFKILFEDHIIYNYQNLIAELSSIHLSNATIFFWPVEPTHLKQQIPVAIELLKRKIPFQFITNKPEVLLKLKQQGFYSFFINENFYSSQQFPTQNIVEQFLTRSIRIKNDDHDKIKSELLNIFEESYKSNYIFIIQLFSFIAFLKEQKSELKLIIGNDLTLEGRLAVSLGKLNNFKTYCIQHGSTSGEPMDSEHISDITFTFGEQAKNHLIKIGNKEENLLITGAPYLDDKINIQSNNSIHPQLTEKLKINKEKPYFLLALSGPGHCTSFEHFNRIVKQVMLLSKKFDYHFVSKLHRKDKIENYTLLNSEVTENKLQIISNNTKGFPEDIFDWLSGCSALITCSSMVAIEAMLMNVPVITVDFMNEHRGVDFIEKEATIHAKTEAELESALVNLINKPETFLSIISNSKKFIESYFYKVDGKASSRIVDKLIN